ncbi:MAG: hypothetical protein HWE15_12735 [Algoriphagus sp.]|uniref:hypothetical protein n=1 Tax=Algoriphagus sp. TaxID=1872435 RepID=UPI0017D6F0C0|nr:hypothetical protein [Algoriphagus sp.]NVJ87169.1 hypothetical protein [Algoriphagus sp.]
MKINLLLLFGAFLFLFSSCENAPGIAKPGKLDPLPYYDVSGFIEAEIAKMDEERVTKSTRINGKEESLEVSLSQEEWREELDAFIRADINKPSLVSSYTTELQGDILIHRLKPGAKNSVQEIRVRIIDDRPIWLTFKVAKESMFYTSYVLGEVYMNQRTQKIDHYGIETTQKIWFLSPNNMRVKGAVLP